MRSVWKNDTCDDTNGSTAAAVGGVVRYIGVCSPVRSFYIDSLGGWPSCDGYWISGELAGRGVLYVKIVTICVVGGSDDKSAIDFPNEGTVITRLACSD